MFAGCMLPSPGLPDANPPGLQAAIWPVPGALAGLALAHAYGAHREREDTGESG